LGREKQIKGVFDGAKTMLPSVHDETIISKIPTGYLAS
jgi:hypothetical protein